MEFLGYVSIWFFVSLIGLLTGFIKVIKGNPILLMLWISVILAIPSYIIKLAFGGL